MRWILRVCEGEGGGGEGQIHCWFSMSKVKLKIYYNELIRWVWQKSLEGREQAIAAAKAAEDNEER